ncbi:MAG: Ltp family lipoprotein [Trichococcus flocculiformis]
MVTDWNQNALQTAVDYLDYSSFSYPGLYDQLVYEGYTAEQAQYAISNLP